MRWHKPFAPTTGVIALALVLLAVGAIGTPHFATHNNLLNIFEQSTGLALASLGQTLVVLTGGIDLSVGSSISLLSELTSGLIDGRGAHVLPTLALTIALGALLGAMNGSLIVFLRVHPLTVTLGTGAALQGLTLLYASQPKGSVPAAFSAIAYGRVAGIPAAAAA